ncbi:hypothetical protein OG474_43575 [Kribbella sp. NBC_01505]|uniref:hypothetical protein n=1 Tax=Kribbella sp. NBC_01505 TaxID=2903580 RepID=UPI00386BB4F3
MTTPIAGGGTTITVAREPALAERIASRVGSVPGVAGLHGGTFGDVVTYLPGSRLAGVRITDDRIQVHVVTIAGRPIHPIAAAVRLAVQDLTDRPVDVTIEDIATPSTT